MQIFLDTTFHRNACFSLFKLFPNLNVYFFLLLLRFNLDKLHHIVNVIFPKQAFPNPRFQIVYLKIS